MDVRQLEAVVAIADHGSFSRAADALGTVQSNISARVARLEKELGTELIDRTSGEVTESGRVVVERARRILQEFESIAADVSELNADIRGTVSLGIIGTAGRWIIPLLIEAQRLQYPHVALRIYEGSNSALEPQLVHGRLDLGVLAQPILAPELTQSPLFNEDLVVIVPRTHPLAARATVSFEVLAQYPLLLPLSGTALRREIDAAARTKGVTLRPVVELDGLRTIASLAFDGYGPAILPATALSQHLRDKFLGVRVDDLTPRRVSVVTRRFGFPAAPVRAITALLHEVVQRATPPEGVSVTTVSTLS